MDSYQNNQQPNQNMNNNNYYFNRPLGEVANSFAVLSLLMGILTIIATLFLTLYFPFIFGGLAIIFAILSKGNKKELHSTAVAGLITSISGIVLNTLIIFFCIIIFLTIPSFRKQLETFYEQQNGESIDEAFGRYIDTPLQENENSETK